MTEPATWNPPPGDARTRPSVRFEPATAAWLLAMVLGAAARLAEYLARPSLHMDEVGLLLNLRRPFRAMFGPLWYAQPAPAGFLAVQWGIVRALGEGELSFRLVSLLASLAALLLFATLARRMLAAWPAALAAALFALSPQLVLFAANVKPYALDVLVAAAAALAGRRLLHEGVSARDAAVYGLAGALLPWLSQASVFVLAGLGIAMLWRHRTGPGLLLVAAWGVSALGALIFALRVTPPSTSEFLTFWWRSGMAPMEPANLVRFILRVPSRLLRLTLGFATWPALILSPVLIFGAWVLRREGWLLLPIGVVVAAALAHLYPFGASGVAFYGRVILFLAVPTAIALASGTEALTRRFPALLGLPLLALLPGWTAFPFRLIETRPTFAALAQQARPGDQALVAYPGYLPWRYYAPRLRLSSLPTVVLRCGVDDPSRYIAALRRLRPGRVWFVSTLGLQPADGHLVRSYLTQNGRLLDRRAWPGTTLELYSLENPHWGPPAARLRRNGDRRFCGGVWRAPEDDGVP